MFHLSAITAFLRISFQILKAVTHFLSSSARDFLCTRLLNPASSRKTLLSLPPETLFEILSDIDAQSLLSAKLACRAFYNATRSRQFWHRLLLSLESTSDGPDFREKLHKHTIQELERWGVQRLRTYDCWVLDEPLVFRPRPFRYSKTTRIWKAQLLPGGRYLLANNLEGQLFVCDLDLPHPQLQLLLDPGEYDARDKTPDNLMSFAVWVNPSAEILSFRIVVWRHMGPEKRGFVTRTRIYQIDLMKNGEELRWNTMRLYGRRSRRYSGKPCAGLSDKFLAEIRVTEYHPEGVRQQLVLNQYLLNETSQSAQNEISVELAVEDDVCAVFVSSYGHVITNGRTFLNIYMISQLEHHDPQHKVAPTYHFPQGCLHRDVAPPFSYRNFAWMVIRHHNEYYLLRLSEDMVNYPPLLTPLGYHPSDPNNRWLPGLVNETAAAALQYDWSLNIITYSWNVEATECAFRIKKSWLPGLPDEIYCYATVGVDIISGRIVLLHLHSEENTCIILDTA